MANQENIMELIEGIVKEFTLHDVAINDLIRQNNEDFNEEKFKEDINRENAICLLRIRNLMVLYGPSYKELYKA